MRRWKAIIASLAITLLWYFITLQCFQIRYESNDDALMNAISAGWIDGNIHADIPFVHFSVGFLLAQLYELTAAVNWYPVLQLFVQALSLFFTCYLFLRNSVSLLFSSTLILVFLLAYLLPYQLNLQYTTTATLAAVTGILALLIGTKKDERKSALLHYFIGFALLLFSVLIRIKVPIMILAITIPIWLYVAWFKKSLQIPKLVLGVVLMFAVVTATEKLYLSLNPVASFQFNYDKERVELQDNPQFQYTPNAQSIADAGWSLNDMQLFQNFMMLDKEVYSLEKLIYISDHRQIYYYAPLPGFFDKLKSVVMDMHITWFASLLLIPILLFVGRSYKSAFVILCMFGMAVMLLYYIYVFILIKYRVFAPMMQAITFMPFLFLLFETNKDNAKLKPLLFGLCLLMLYTGYYYINDTTKIQNKLIGDNQKYAEWLDNNLADEAIIVPFTNAIIYEFVNVLDTKSAFFDNVKIVPTGWLFNLGVYDNAIDKLQVEKPMYELLEKNEFYIVLSSQFSEYTLPFIEKYYEERGLTACLQLVNEYESTFDKKLFYIVKCQ